MRPIRLSAPRVDGSLVLVDLDSADASRYLKSGTLRFKYTGVDVSGVDQSLLVIPALGAIISVAYAAGLAVDVESVDAEFAARVESLSRVWKDIYPNFQTEGFSLVGRRVENRSAGNGGDLLLYSGGVDALASLLRNKKRVKGLVSVWGADVPLARKDLWFRLQSLMDETSAIEGIARYVVKTNMRRFFNKGALSEDFLGGGKETWWMKAQHGLALLAMCAPISTSGGYSRALIASSHSEEFNTPWGSSPKTDNKVGWAGVTAFHDAFELTRQGKIGKVIAPYLMSGGKARLAVCYKSKRGGGETINCGICEKCIRSATGFIVAGIDPELMGIPLNIAAMRSWLSRVDSDSGFVSDNQAFMWNDIKKAFSSRDLIGFDDSVVSYVGDLMSVDFRGGNGPAAKQFA